MHSTLQNISTHVFQFNNILYRLTHVCCIISTQIRAQSVWLRCALQISLYTLGGWLDKYSSDTADFKLLLWSAMRPTSLVRVCSKYKYFARTTYADSIYNYAYMNIMSNKSWCLWKCKCAVVRGLRCDAAFAHQYSRNSHLSCTYMIRQSHVFNK